MEIWTLTAVTVIVLRMVYFVLVRSEIFRVFIVEQLVVEVLTLPSLENVAKQLHEYIMDLIMKI